MGIYYKNRMLIISLVLAASGVVTCGLALADIFLPRGSAIVVLASIPLLGAIALGGLIAFAWVCELLDRRGGLHLPTQTAPKSQKPWRVVGPGGPSSGASDKQPDRRQPVPKTSLPLRPLIG
jgi:hypothetical protein